ncbi:MAG: hypothetical protein DMF52_05025 [Acidobacteria bacterium]|nr:MAG: hypothetical protein DMF52_05025 [Acidobacteriota bacterium]
MTIRLLFALCCVLFILAIVPAMAQEVRNTSYTTRTGERVLRIETVLPVPAAEVWSAFATEAGARLWMAPVVKLDLRTGGSLRTRYEAKGSIGEPGTIVLGILNYIEEELITFKVTLNETFPDSIRREDKDLQEIVQIIRIGPANTKVVSSMLGWGRGKAWDDAYRFFAKGNEWTYKQLAGSLTRRDGP